MKSIQPDQLDRQIFFQFKKLLLLPQIMVVDTLDVKFKRI